MASEVNMMNAKVDIHNPLYNFLVEPKFRWLRHLILILFIGLVVSDNTYRTYNGKVSSVSFYLILGVYMIAYLSVIYLNIYWSIPKLLLRKKYIQYVIILSATAGLLLFGINFIEYFVYSYKGIPFDQVGLFSEEQNPTIYLIYNYVLIIIYLTSISAVVFYKQWMLNVKKVEQLKAERFNSELSNLKNRISPDFLFDKLRRAAGYFLTNPQQASRILFQLSRVLRYQLYDSSRKEVLLNSEIKYLNDYLTLEKECNERFDFKITYPESARNYLIPSSLLILFVENSLKKLSEVNDNTWIHIDFSITGDILTFNVTDNRAMPENTKDKDSIRLIYRQLELMQNKEYSLSSEPDRYLNQFKTVFQYKL